MKPAILIVDDEIDSLNSFIRVLRKEYDIYSFSSGKDALEFMKSSDKDIEVVISDYLMPEMNGVEFLRLSLNYYPHSARALMTGYNDIKSAIDAVNESKIFRFIAKPCSYEVLKEHLEVSVAQYKLIQNERKIGLIKSKFYSMISHEYKNPLSKIMLATELLNKYHYENNEEAFQKYISSIRGVVKEMNRLLEDVLQVGQIEIETNKSEMKVIELARYIEYLVKDFSTYDKNHKFIFNSPGSKSTILANERFIQLFVNNILSNSVKYAPSESEIIVNIEETEQNFAVSVKDFGKGIDGEEIKHIFEPFYRGEAGKARNGSGLGLTIAKQAVEALGGTIEANSAKDNGAIFTVTLPKKARD